MPGDAMARKRSGCLWAVALLLLAAAAAALLWSRSALDEPFPIAGGERIFAIEKGMGAGAICQKAQQEGLVRHAGLLKFAIAEEGDPRAIQAGEYLISGSPSAREVAQILLSGKVLLHRITFAEGLRRDEMAALMVEKGFGSEEEVDAATCDVSLIRDLDPLASDLEGYLHPETYSLPREAKADVLVKAMVAQFRDQLPAGWEERAKEMHMSLREVVTLASIIEKETAEGTERGLISGVFHNRLQKGMLLQTDPTIIYSLVLLDAWHGDITYKNKLVDHPYNTYVYAGLPPGPICSPGAASIEAALNPEPTDALYFVSRGDGTHVFSSSLDDHNRAVNTHQRR